MIRYALKCDQDHGFDSWFQSADACETLISKAMVACPTCGSTAVRKSLMAPDVQPARNAPTAPPAPAPEPPAAAPRPPSQEEREAAIAELRRKVEENSDYVGGEFAAEARAIHDGTAPERSIYGEARPDEAQALFEDGIPVAPLPFAPRRKMN